MTLKFLFALAAIVACPIGAAADEYPTIEPYFVATNDDGEEETGTSFSGSAPLYARFYAGTKNAEGWTAYYEWRFTLQRLNGEEDATPYLIRYEEDTEYTFRQAGLNKVVCYATFTRGGETVEYTEEYWAENNPLTVSISESRLEMPNAFSPNGDGINDIYKAKEGWQSLVEFHAYIFNRWGQKLYEWTDPAGGWDGKHNGKDVKQGVYYCLVKAKGADGRKFTIRKDVNLLRGYSEETGTNSYE